MPSSEEPLCRKVRTLPQVGSSISTVKKGQLLPAVRAGVGLIFISPEGGILRYSLALSVPRTNHDEMNQIPTPRGNVIRSESSNGSLYRFYLNRFDISHLSHFVSRGILSSVNKGSSTKRTHFRGVRKRGREKHFFESEDVRRKVKV